MSEDKKLSLSLASHLLERPVDDAYLEEWTNLFSQDRMEGNGRNFQSVVVFRLGNEWFALSTKVFSEISKMRVIRRIPHRSTDTLRGLVNLRGQLQLCVDLAKILEIEDAEDPSQGMLMSIAHNGKTWVFVASEILGIFPYDVDVLKNVPVTVAKSTANYLKGVFSFDDKHASILDEELLFYSLDRRVT